MPISDPVKAAIAVTQLYGVRSLIEVGCGKGGILSQFPASFRVGVDHFEPYLAEAKQQHPDILFCRHDIRHLDEFLTMASFDAVISFDVLEHLEQPDMENLVVVCEELSRKLVIFFSPLDEAGLEAFTEDVDENPSMKHVTIIREQFFLDRGYKTTVYKNYHGEGVHAVLAIKEW